MNFLQNGLAAVAVAVTGGWCMAPEASAQAEEPIITFRTNIYETYGAENAFHIVLGSTEKDYFDVDCGFGMVEVEVDQATWDSTEGAMSGTAVPCVVSDKGIVKIYGDASKIDYIDAEGCYIEWIDMDKCTNLAILDLQHNELKRLDLTPFSKLQALYLSDNTFTAETPLKVGGNKPDLAILELDVIDYMDQSFNLSDYPSLMTFDGYHNFGLYNVDPTGCPELLSISVELTPVSSLDVSKNPKLQMLNISESRITSIDISNNPNLVQFYASHVSGFVNTDVKLSGIDLRSNPNLQILSLSGNNLKSIDLSNNPYITHLLLQRNSLETIDVTANVNLYSVNLSYNNLNFATLPLPNPDWFEYYYYRDPLPCDRSYAVGSEIDFSSQVCREGTTTIARVWRNPYDREPELLDETAYEFSDGKIVFNTIPADSVYVEFVNDAFEEYSLRSGSFKVKNADEIGLPSKTVIMNATSAMGGKTIGLRVGMGNASDTAPQKFFVDFGDGEQKEFAATTIGLPDADNVTGTLPSGTNVITVYAPEGAVVTAFEVKDVKLTSIDLTAATELQQLNVNGTNITSIDLSYNRCLQALDISNNRLSNVSLKGVYGNYEKFVLTEINASNNRLSNFEIVANRQLLKLDLSGNYLTTYDLKDFDNLLELNLSGNRLVEDMSLTYLGNARRIDLSNNRLTSVTLTEMPSIEHFDISNNALTLQTLPLVSDVACAGYVYAPQKDIEIAEFAPGVNLTAQDREVDGTGTTFKWLKADGSVLTEGVDYTCNKGATKFLDENLGKVYCEMTNPAFPALSGENVLKTTQTTVTGAPTTVVATFTTLEDGNNAEVIFTGTKTSALYIDWRGDGTEFLQYTINGQSYTSYPGQTTYAGADVTVYTYESPADVKVFSIYNVPMSRMDASPMGNLSAFSVGGAGLDENTLVFPAKGGITELNLEGNNFSTEDFTGFPALKTQLILSNNKYETFDMSKLPNLEALSLSNNGLKSIKFGGNNALWAVELSDNELEELDVTGAPALEQIVASTNKLSHIDVSSLSGTLKVLLLENNRFDFSTLPLQSQLPQLLVYYYSNQAVIDAECVEGKVDLSSQAYVDGTPTTYRWFLGDVTVDEESGELSGEELETGGDDPEFTVENGVTTFHYEFDKKVTCVMTNDIYPNLMLYTNPLTVSLAGITGVTADAADAPVDVYSISGVKVRSQVNPNEAVSGLAPGFYVVGNRKVLVK